MELWLLVILLVAVGGGLLWDRLSQRSQVARLAERWARETQRVITPPIGVICRGDRPSVLGQDSVLGALGAANGRVLFVGQRRTDYNLDAPLAWLRWIGLRTRVKVSWNRRIEFRALTLHLETPQGWRVFTFSDGPVEDVALPIARAAGLRLEDIGESPEDFGPAPAVPLRRDAAGAWIPAHSSALDLAHLPPSWDGMTQTLYLAPDRLLFDWQHPIPLDEIQRVEVYPEGHAANPFQQHILRLEHAAAGQDPVEAAFLLFNAGDWAGVLERRTKARVVHHAIPNGSVAGSDPAP